MRGNDIKFIHFISIVTVVYNNDINLKILMSHPTTTLNNLKLTNYNCIKIIKCTLKIIRYNFGSKIMKTIIEYCNFIIYNI